jgi:hypothetical protein
LLSVLASVCFEKEYGLSGAALPPGCEARSAVFKDLGDPHLVILDTPFLAVAVCIFEEHQKGFEENQDQRASILRESKL